MNWLIGIVAVIGLTVDGCSAVPVTDGFSSGLPRPGTPTIVWGDDPSAVGTATIWLQKQELMIVEQGTLAQGVEADKANFGHTLRDEASILRLARQRQVPEVVFVDLGGDYRAPMVTVRGVHVESGQVRWSGSARYPSFESRPPKDMLANLTCQALATAWNFRPPGTQWALAPEDSCLVEEKAFSSR